MKLPPRVTEGLTADGDNSSQLLKTDCDTPSSLAAQWQSPFAMTLKIKQACKIGQKSQITTKRAKDAKLELFF
jgi:hypothetical protein